MNTTTPSSSTVFKLTSLVIVLAAFATRHAFADFDTLYVAGLAVAALWIMQAQEAAPSSGWNWVRGLAGAAVLPVHGLLLAGIVAGPAIFTKKDAQTPHFVGTPVKQAKPAGGCGSGGCGGAAGGCGGSAGGGGCGSSAGGCGAGGSCGSGSSATAATQQAAIQRPNAAMATSQPRPGFFQVPQGAASRPSNAPATFNVMPQPGRPAQPGTATAMARPNVQTFAPAPTPQVSPPTPTPAVNVAAPNLSVAPTPQAVAPATAPQASPPAPAPVVNAAAPAVAPTLSVAPNKPAAAPAAVPQASPPGPAPAVNAAVAPPAPAAN